MNLQVPPILYPALASLIVNRLQKSLEIQEVSGLQRQKIMALDGVALNLSPSSPSGFQDLPLNRIKVTNRLEYVSALAFKLQPLQSQPALLLAQQLVAVLSSSSALDQPSAAMERIWQHFVISASPPGWIHLQLTDPGLAAWLQGLGSCCLQNVTRPDSISPSELDRNCPEVFAAIHTYARCCSLLQLAAQENLIQIAQTDLAGVVLDQPIPWLDADRKLRCQQPEWNLILQISDTMDYLAQPQGTAAQQSLKVLHRLSQAFQTFHAACRIWGDVKLHELPIAQVRLGLTLITQRVLHILLTQKLNLDAPSCL